MTRRSLLLAAFALAPDAALAHAAEQGFVLLLPTGVYTAAGAAVVALTVALMIALPERAAHRLFAPRRFAAPDWRLARVVASLCGLALFAWLVRVGLTGPRDPLANLLPLAFWTLFWAALVTLAGGAGDIWRWINPWHGLHRLIGAPKPPLNLPESWGMWPAFAVFMAFSAFLLADIAPDDPARLARFLGAYWFATMAAVILFGEAWLKRGEAASALFACYGALSPLRLRPNGGAGAPGWRLTEWPASLSAGVFTLALLGAGSFDGLNETFWWLAQIGVNPLEFPGRSAVVGETLTGLFSAVALLIAVFAGTVLAGLKLAGEGAFAATFARLALSVMPIAFGYHVAHYLPSFLVNGQYAMIALNDPFGTGADLLGLQGAHVTTGFFNRLESVRLIWLTQAGAVVIGHVWAVVLAHRIALDLFSSPRRALMATLPLSLFMVAYTFLGLWLLAAPRGA